MSKNEVEAQDNCAESRWLHDAEIWGDLNTEFDGFLEREITFMTGKLYPDDNRKSTRDGDWQATTLPLVTWLNDPNFGLLRHPVGKTKDGTAICPSINIDGARKDSAVKTMTAIGIDVDSGTSIDHVLERLEAAEIFAIVYTTFNHLTTRLELKHDDVMRKLALDASPDLGQIKEYLRLHHATRYDAAFIDAVEIEDARTQTKDGLRIILKVPAIDKFRVVIPLAEPVELADLAPTMAGWKEVWADKVTGVCVNMLDTEFDTASCDLNRLFFCPRHKEGAEFYSAIVMGKPLHFGDIQPYSKADYIRGRQPQGDPFLAGGSEGGEVERFLMPESGRSLNKWHHEHKHRFLIADLMEAHAADKVRNVGGERDGTLHIECPFEGDHSTSGGTATMVMNPHANEKEVWTVFCHHDACKGRHKLEFLQQMLADEWFPESVLKDEEFVLDDDSVIEPRTVSADGAAIQIKAAGITSESSEGDIKAFLAKFLDCDQASRKRITDALAKPARGDGVTLFTSREISGMWKAVSGDAAKDAMEAEREARKALPTPDYLPFEDATPTSVAKAAAASKFLPGGFTHKDGWFGQINFESGNFQRICREFEVVYCADGKKGSGRTNEVTIRYQHRSSQLGIVESVFRLGDTYKDSGAILGKLKNEGLDFSPDAKTETVLTLLRSINSGRKAVFLEQSGWTEDRKAFISPTGEVVTDAKFLYVLDSTMRVSAEKAGTLDQAIEAASAALRGKNAKFFLPGFMIGAVGCLADFLGTEMSVILANEGKAKHGKSTALKSGVSWFAIASGGGLLITGDVTPTAMEVMAVKASGAAFAPDEQGTSTMTAADEQRFMLQYAGGIGRARGRADGGMRDILQWRGAMGISTEKGFLGRIEDEQNRDSTVDIKAGALSRIFTVNFDDAVSLDPIADKEELDAYQVLAHGGAHGWLGPAFAAELLRLGIDEVQGRVSALEQKWGKSYSGAASRVVTTAALFGVAIEISQDCGLLPANAQSANAGLTGIMKDLMDATIDARSHHLDTSTQATASLRRNIIRAMTENRILGPNDEGHGQTVLGCWKGSKDGTAALQNRTYILPVDRLGQLGVKTDLVALVKLLREEGGLVEPSENGKFATKGLHEYVPGEGKVKNLRVSGEWVHGDADAEED